MKHDPPTEHSSRSIIQIAEQMVAAGVTPLAVANEIAFALGRFLALHFSPTQAAGLLREQASKVDPPERRHFKPQERQLLELEDKAHQVITGLQIQGFEETAAIAMFMNVCIARTARTAGAAGAAELLRRLARNVDANRAEIQAAATAH